MPCVKKKKKGNFWRVAILGGRKYGIPQGPGFAYHGPFCIPWACRIRGMVCMIRVGVAQSQQTLRNMYASHWFQTDYLARQRKSHWSNRHFRVLLLRNLSSGGGHWCTLHSPTTHIEVRWTFLLWKQTGKIKLCSLPSSSHTYSSKRRATSLD